MEECDLVCLAWGGVEAIRCERSREVVTSVRSAQKPNAVARVCVWGPVEDRGVDRTTRRAGPGPGGRRSREAEV